MSFWIKFVDLAMFQPEKMPIADKMPPKLLVFDVNSVPSHRLVREFFATRIAPHANACFVGGRVESLDDGLTGSHLSFFQETAAGALRSHNLDVKT